MKVHEGLMTNGFSAAYLGFVVVVLNYCSEPLGCSFCSVNPHSVTNNFCWSADENALSVLIVRPLLHCLFALWFQAAHTFLQF